MVQSTCGNVYLHDFVMFHKANGCRQGHVNKFFSKEDVPGIFAEIQSLEFVNGGTCVIGKLAEIPVTDIVAITHAPMLIRIKLSSSSNTRLMTQKEYEAFTTPHKFKSIAGDLPVLMLPLILYSDDTSGNVSKQWNKFDSWCVKLAGLPNRENQKLHNIFHICSSNKVNSIAMAGPLVQDLNNLERQGVRAYDAYLGREVLVTTPVLCIICDNYRASEVTNSLGPSSRMFCRMCMADREGDPAVLGAPRMKEETLQQMANISQCKTEREKNRLKTKYGTRSTPNSLLKLSCDLHSSTPVETLHTILLGPYKYMFRSLMERLKSSEKEEIQARVESFDFSGLDTKLSYNLCRHFRSFVGRDFKALAQCALFLLGAYMTSKEKVLWISLSKVFKIAYCQPFHCNNLVEYQQICQDFVDTVKLNSPELLKKLKVHLILHLPQNMHDFGPTSAFNTERCETFNSLIRSRNVYGNRLSPSRDIAKGFSLIHHLRFLCSGGSFNGEKMCGEGLVSLFRSSAVQSFLNGVPTKEALSHKFIYQPGTIRKVCDQSIDLRNLEVLLQAGVKLRLEQMRNNGYTFILGGLSLTTPILPAGAVIGHSENRELINVGSYVQFSVAAGENDIAKLAACFVAPDCGSFCIVQIFEHMDALGLPIFNEYDCPLFNITSLFRCVPSTTIAHSVSVHHECSSTCTFTRALATTVVEREHVVSQKLNFVHDFSNTMYSLNVYCMHSFYGFHT